MPEGILNLIKGDKMGSETDYRDALPVNMTAVLKPMFGASGYMIQEAGLTQFSTTPGITRGGIYNERFGDHYRIQGGSLVSLATDGSSTTLGRLQRLPVVRELSLGAQIDLIYSVRHQLRQKKLK